MLNLINTKKVLREKLEREFEPRKVKEILAMVNKIASIQADIALRAYIGQELNSTKLTTGGIK